MERREKRGRKRAKGGQGWNELLARIGRRDARRRRRRRRRDRRERNRAERGWRGEDEWRDLEGWCGKGRRKRERERGRWRERCYTRSVSNGMEMRERDEERRWERMDLVERDVGEKKKGLKAGGIKGWMDRLPRIALRSHMAERISRSTWTSGINMLIT